MIHFGLQDMVGWFFESLGLHDMVGWFSESLQRQVTCTK